MATIKKKTSERTGAVSYQVQVRLRGRRSVTRTFKRRRDAETWARAQEGEIRRRREVGLPDEEQHTVAELIDRYLDRVMPTKRSGRSATQQLLWWRERIGDLDLRVVTPALLTEHKHELLTTRGPTGKRRTSATVARYMAALSHVFTFAVKEWQWMPTNPMLSVRKPKEPRGRVRFLEEDELLRLLNACQARPNPHLYTVVLLAVSTGMRQGEILGLRWRDVDFERGRVILQRTKNDERRAVPVTGPALIELKRHHVRQGTPNRRVLVFPSEKKPTQPMDLTRPWRVAMREAEIEDFRFHDLRHCAASYLAMSGASLSEIAAVLGHKTLSMVKRYAHLSDAHTATVVSRMNQTFLSNVGGDDDE